MGFYQRWIVPRLINLAMRNRSLDAYRQRTIGAASGLVLEIGVGSGQNLPLYGSAVHRVYAIDPSMELLHMARNRIAEARLPVSLIRASVEQLPFAGTIFDTIIMTWTLCSIPNPVAALIEMRRVLSPAETSYLWSTAIPGITASALAASLDPMLEAHRRSLPSRPENG
jgi:ubiquinone/menaquinone biosynthesis C-methylase UbiE